jgi:hypothetical protein
VDLIKPEQASAAKQIIASLLNLKRVCAVVHPIMHEVKKESRRAGKPPRLKKEPTGDFLVELFPGASIPCFGSDEDQSKLVVEVNTQLMTLVREHLVGDVSSLREAAAGAKTLSALKNVQTRLIELERANKFRFQVQSPSLVPCDGQLSFRGANANQRAQRFCGAVNTYLDQLVSAAEAEMRRKLVEGLNPL